MSCLAYFIHFNYASTVSDRSRAISFVMGWQFLVITFYLASQLTWGICLAFNITSLTDATFDTVTKVQTGESGDWLIRFYAPWCPHSHNMLDAFAEAALQLDGEINVAEVDASINRSGH